MAHIAKMHPTANWLRVPAHIYARALERNIENGKPDYVHFWTIELPALLEQPQYRQQAEERIAELQAKADEIASKINAQVGSLLEEQATADLEKEQIKALLGGQQ